MNRRLQRTMATATALGVVVTGLGAAVASADSGSTGGAIAWGACEDEDLAAAGAQCGDLSVPLDYANPTGRQITIAVSILRATAPAAERQGPLLLNFGGPGGTGVDGPSYFAGVLPADIVSTYDIIGFDPRGIGQSEPALSCGDGSDLFLERLPDVRPDTTLAEDLSSSEEAWLELYDKFIAACDRTHGELFPHMTSTDVVADMDAIRAALGAEQISFYGFSYGTYLGQLYASTYPSHTRRMVLDGNLDPKTWGYQDGLITGVNAEIPAQRFFAWVADQDDVYGLGSTAAEVNAAYYRGEEFLRENPGEFVGSYEWNSLVLFALYSQELWPVVAPVFAALEAGDIAPLEEFYAGEELSEEELEEALVAFDNSYASYTSYICGDSTWPADYDQWRRDTFAADAIAPFGTWIWVLGGLGCRVWPYQKPLAEVNGSDVPALLLSNTAADPATPLVNAVSTRLQFPNSVLVVDAGTTGHSQTLAGNECVDERVFAYLRDGSLPERIEALTADLTCPGLPLPEPLDLDSEEEAEGTTETGAATEAAAETAEAETTDAETTDIESIEVTDAETTDAESTDATDSQSTESTESTESEATDPDATSAETTATETPAATSATPTVEGPEAGAEVGTEASSETSTESAESTEETETATDASSEDTSDDTAAAEDELRERVTAGPAGR